MRGAGETASFLGVFLNNKGFVFAFSPSLPLYYSIFLMREGQAPLHMHPSCLAGAFGPERLQTGATFNYVLVNRPPDTCKNNAGGRGKGTPGRGSRGGDGDPAPARPGPAGTPRRAQAGRKQRASGAQRALSPRTYRHAVRRTGGGHEWVFSPWVDPDPVFPTPSLSWDPPPPQPLFARSCTSGMLILFKLGRISFWEVKPSSSSCSEESASDGNTG